MTEHRVWLLSHGGTDDTAYMVYFDEETVRRLEANGARVVSERILDFAGDEVYNVRIDVRGHDVSWRVSPGPHPDNQGSSDRPVD